MKKTGFTLVELLIYIGLLAILMAILTRLFTGITDVQLTSEATGAVEEDSRYIYSRLAYDIPRATNIVGTGSSLILLINGVANTYSISGNNLVLANDAGVNQLNSIGSGVTNLSFTQVGNSVQIAFTITSTIESSGGPDTRNIETTIALR